MVRVGNKPMTDPAPKQASNIVTEYMDAGGEVEIGEQSREAKAEREADGSGWARSVAGGGAGVAVGGLATRQVSTPMYVVGTFGLLPPPTSWPLLCLAFPAPHFGTHGSYQDA